jgi:cholesterol oxidase
VRLANPQGELDAICERGELVDVLVIGSGYGASVCAARMAEAGVRVVLLERGREFSYDDGKPFPDTLHDLRDNVQIDSHWFERRHRLGLFNFHIHSDVDVLVGCGLGGTSLINSNVAIEPDPRVFQRPIWPGAIRNRPWSALAPFYERALSVLQPAYYPSEHRAVPRKLAAMLANGGERCAVTVHFGDAKYNSVGVEQSDCNDCGDCNTGCNFKAKKTTYLTYLPIAKSFGAQIFVQCDVDYVERSEDAWLVHFQRLETGAESLEVSHTVRARTVILGAGVLGTTGILLRSKERGLPLSAKLGARFSGNGDTIAFGYNCDERLDSVGCGNLVPYVAPYRLPEGIAPVGATILGIIDQRKDRLVEDGIIIEEATVPSSLARVMRVAAQLLGATGKETQHGFEHWFHERLAEGRDLFGNHADGALNRTLLFLLMGHDGASGRIELSGDGRPVVRWPDRARSLIDTENGRAHEITRMLGGEFIRDPLSRYLHNQFTVHPLGGCPMGDDADGGVVDDAGRVFCDGGETHAGLYVADASVIPTSLGVNPLLTITALAERIAEYVASGLERVAGRSSTLSQVTMAQRD